MSRDKAVIVIAGMHRSGTSLVSSLLQHAGVNIGDTLVGPLKGNPHGHFEDVGFFRFQEKILNRFGKNIFVEDASSLGMITREETKEALTIIKQRSTYDIWGWKDPRTSLFLDFWFHLIPNAMPLR